MVNKRFRVVREVVIWDSDAAFHNAEVSDEYRQQCAERIAKGKGWKVVESKSELAAQEAGHEAK